ncbi:hypothetical protein NEOLI_003774 [Neolecta irregularis DAH-3]|uniref:Uncharacterized protein n=1 Tax=Neolecta irregularis (strain DAH-3) TaxID=1198029 RepID=A0A1U7LQ08_NEOID|nr:hypothetical protein NEOLI_003774 [Neolecta irregularis DAH-3]|eukprot:OLL24673.1 hypothetical protein NEOLI_003774 [Neolecta irregularis DAH-3]
MNTHSIIIWNPTTLESESNNIQPEVDTEELRLILTTKMIFRRLLSTSLRNFNAQTTAYVSAPSNSVFVRKKTAGRFRGSILGFFLGTTVAGIAGYSFLIQEYRSASEILMSSRSTIKISAYLKRIDELEKQVRRLNKDGVLQEDVESLREEMKNIYNGLQIEHLELKTQVNEMDKDLAILIKDARTKL